MISLRKVGLYLSSLVRGRMPTIDEYFKSIEKVAEAEEERNKKLEGRIELKKKEHDLKQRVYDARDKRKKLTELLGEYDPSVQKRQRMKWMVIVIFVFAVLMLMFKSCGC